MTVVLEVFSSFSPYICFFLMSFFFLLRKKERKRNSENRFFNYKISFSGRFLNTQIIMTAEQAVVPNWILFLAVS